jgi:putative membrane protein
MRYERRGFVWFSNSPPNEDENWLIAILIRWAINALALWVAAEIVPGITYDGWEGIVLAAAILGLINAFIKPILFIITLPITCLTLGIFLLILNALMLQILSWIADWLDIEFSIDNFGDAFLGALIVTVVSFLLTQVRMSFSQRRGRP